MHGFHRCDKPGQYERSHGRGITKITFFVCGRHLAMLMEDDTAELVPLKGGAA